MASVPPSIDTHIQGNGAAPTPVSTVVGVAAVSSAISPGAVSSAIFPGAVSSTMPPGAVSSAAPVPTPTNAVNKHGLTAGAVAGIATGCFIVGAAIAAVILLLFRRKKNRNVPTYRLAPVEYHSAHPHRDKNPVVATTPNPSSIDNYLPQPIEDAAITREVSKISDHIKKHVRAYYHSSPVNASNVNEADLEDFSAALGVNTSVSKRLFLESSARSETVRIFLAWVILSRYDGTRAQTLLPGSISAIAHNAFQENASDAAILLSTWKVNTGTLMKKQPALPPNTVPDTVSAVRSLRPEDSHRVPEYVLKDETHQTPAKNTVVV